jgi:hypothetical protein
MASFDDLQFQSDETSFPNHQLQSEFWDERGLGSFGANDANRAGRLGHNLLRNTAKGNPFKPDLPVAPTTTRSAFQSLARLINAQPGESATALERTVQSGNSSRSLVRCPRREQIRRRKLLLSLLAGLRHSVRGYLYSWLNPRTNAGGSQTFAAVNTSAST